MLKVTAYENFCATLNSDYDKSITIRAILIGAVSKGQTVIVNPLISEDTLSAIRCARVMGATVKREKRAIRITGTSQIANGKSYYCGNSGTLARLLIGLLSGAGVSAKISGDKSLKARPMNRIIQPLLQRGAIIKGKNGCLPVTISPAKLTDFCYQMPIDSAQVKSAILLSGVTSGAYTQVIENNKTRDHTEVMLKYFGASLEVNDKVIELNGGTLTAKQVVVAQDPSSASYYLAIGLLKGEVTVNNLLHDKIRCAYLNKLIECGAKIQIEKINKTGCFSTCSVTAKKSVISEIIVNASEVGALIDELPLLAVIACFNSGAKFFGVSELKVKESDRFKGIISLANRLGANAFESDNGIVIQPAKAFNFFEFSSEDHRMTMCAHLAMKCAVGGVLKNEQSVNVSFKNYFKNLNKNAFALIGGNVQNSLSPIIHKHILDSFGFSEFSYQTRSLCDYEVDVFLKKCPYKAINVTIPHKNALLSMAKSASREALKSGGTNFVYKNRAYSFDGKGLLVSIEQAGFDLRGKRVLIYGTGGAGRSIALALVKSGATVYLQNRTKQTALDFISSFKGKNAPKYYNGENCDLLINATSVTCESVFDKQQVENASLVIDINYGKSLALENLAKECNVSFLNGLEMLFYQAYYADCIIAKQKFEKSKAVKCYLDFKVKYENSCS